VASIWRDLGVSVFLAILGAVLAVLWPWWQDRRRRRRLFALLRRELQEVGPIDPLPGKEWWEHLTKRFLHEELFRRANVSANRDFLLSLHPVARLSREPALDRVRPSRPGAVEVPPRRCSGTRRSLVT